MTKSRKLYVDVFNEVRNVVIFTFLELSGYAVCSTIQLFFNTLMIFLELANNMLSVICMRES